MILMDFNLDLKWNRIESTRPYWVQHDYKEIDTEQFIRRIAAKCHPGDRIDLPRGALYPRLCDPGQPITQINGDVVCTMAPL